MVPASRNQAFETWTGVCVGRGYFIVQLWWMFVVDMNQQPFWEAQQYSCNLWERCPGFLSFWMPFLSVPSHPRYFIQALMLAFMVQDPCSSFWTVMGKEEVGEVLVGWTWLVGSGAFQIPPLIYRIYFTESILQNLLQIYLQNLF